MPGRRTAANTAARGRPQPGREQPRRERERNPDPEWSADREGERHPDPERNAAREGQRGRGRRRKAGVVVFWTVGAIAVVLLGCVLWYAVALNQALDHPDKENGFSDWLCSGHTSTCEP